MEKQLPLLDRVAIASPCEADWDAMMGDDRARFCSHCRLHVYNLSDMSRAEAEAFVRQREGQACVRFHRRRDGTLLTRDCPIGFKALRQRFTRAVAAIAGVMIALLCGTLFGGLFQRLKPDSLLPPAQSFANWIKPPVEPLYYPMGQMILVTPQPPPPIPLVEPAETPLLPPTVEQIEQIRDRLAE
jgi:hypothetical protein